MRRITLFLFAALVCVPSSARAQQLPGNPNSGSITVSTSVVNTLTPYTNNSNGTINFVSGGNLTNDMVGTMNNSGMISLSAGGILTNCGTLINDPNGTINNNGHMDNTLNGTLYNLNDLNNNSGAMLKNDGLIVTMHPAQFISSGTYVGNGTIVGEWKDNGHLKAGNQAVQERGAVSRMPSSAGVLTTEGNYYKRAGSHEIELGGLFDGGGNKSLTEFDWLDVTGDVELAGTLEVYLIDSFELLAGMSFDILKVGGTLTGEYDGLGEGHKVGSFSGTNLFITYAGGDGSSVTLFSRAVPEPAAILLALLGLALLPRRRRR